MFWMRARGCINHTCINIFNRGSKYRYTASSSVVDPHHFDADPDSTYHPNADSYSDFLLDADPGCGYDFSP
jgi:hypothetical protein